MAYNNAYGTKYEATKDLNRAELKALMLADLKATMPKGVRVTLREGRGSFSLTATIRGFTGIVNPERMRHDVSTPHEFVPEFRLPRHTPAAIALEEKVTALLEAYNFDNSDIQTDYFNVRFYLRIEFKEERAERERIETEARPSNVVALPVENAQERFMREAGAL